MKLNTDFLNHYTNTTLICNLINEVRSRINDYPVHSHDKSILEQYSVIILIRREIKEND